MQHDDQNHYEDMDLLAGDMDDGVIGETFAPMVDNRARQQRQKMFYIIVLVLACVGGGIIWKTLSSDAPAEMPAPAPIAQEAAPAPAPVATPALPDGVTPPVAAADAQAQTPAAEPSTTIPGSVADMVNAAQQMPVINQIPTAAIVPDAPVAPVAESAPTDMTVPALPVADANAVPAPVTETPAPAEQAMETPPAPEANNTVSALPQPTAVAALPADTTTTTQPTTAEAMAPPVAENTAPQDNIMPPPTEPVAPVVATEQTDRLSALESQIQTLATEVVAAKNAAPAAGATDPAVAEQLQNLAMKLEQITAQVNAIDQRISAAPAVDVVEDAPPIIEKKIEVQQAPVKKPAPVRKKPVVAKAPAPKVASAWQLHSAQPGVAWLGRTGTNDMARYAVGDSVPGLGTVQSVSQEAGMWVVRTSGGMVKQ